MGSGLCPLGLDVTYQNMDTSFFFFALLQNSVELIKLDFVSGGCWVIKNHYRPPAAM